MLKLIGYWKEPDSPPEWPDPRYFVDEDWGKDSRGAIVDYLRSGVVVHEFLGCSTCRFGACVPDELMGNRELSDGAWLWPEGLAHYVERHHVKLPDEYLEHMRQGQFQVPQHLDPQLLASAQIDSDFWKQWSRDQRAPSRRSRYPFSRLSNLWTAI
jgi:hypothetical protein